MIHTIGEILKDKLVGFTYVDRIAGIVSVASEKKQGGNIVKYPIACDVEKDCDDRGKLQDLVPDEGKLSVMYFEDLGGSAFEFKEGRDLHFVTRIRLVGWLNLKKLGKTDCSVTSQVVAHIITRLESTKLINPIPFTRLSIGVISQVPKTPSIFSRYTYDETNVQYLMYPFDYFAIDFIVKYSINENCVPEFNAGAELICDDN